jgi:hypothetical protein
MWAVESLKKERASKRKKEGETALTKTKIIKQKIKAREAQNHNNHGERTPSHLNSLVKIFASLVIWVQRKACIACRERS